MSANMSYGSLKSCLLSAALLLVALLPCAGIGEEAKREWTVSMSVDALSGDSKSSSKGLGSKTSGNWHHRTTQHTTQTTLTRNKKWTAHISCAGKDPPKEAKLSVFYIGYRGKNLCVMGKNEYEVKLDPAKRTDVDLISPSAKMVRTKTISHSRWRGGAGKTGAKSSMSGDRISGCVVQLVVQEDIIKTYATQSSWIEGLHNEPFTESRLLKIKSGKL